MVTLLMALMCELMWLDCIFEIMQKPERVSECRVFFNFDVIQNLDGCEISSPGPVPSSGGRDLWPGDGRAERQSRHRRWAW